MFRSFSFKNIQQFFIPGLVVIALGLAFFSGTLWQKVKIFENGTGIAQETEQAQALPQISIDTIKDLFNKDVLKFGDANRKVLFVEVADPSCPYCHAAAGKNATIYKNLGATFQLKEDGGSYVAPTVEMKKLVDSGQASYIYLYYPGHNNGEMGMKAMYCANEKGKFWEAHDLLMTEAGYTLMNETVVNEKSKSGVVADFLKNVVDTSSMKSCLDSGKYDARLASDQSLATSLQIQGTPGFYVNTTNFPGAYSFTDMKSVVDAALK